MAVKRFIGYGDYALKNIFEIKIETDFLKVKLS